MEDRMLRMLARVVRELRSMTDEALSAQELCGRQVMVDGRGGPVQTWVHGRLDGCRPVVFELHGGGFALGDARKTDKLREWASKSFDAVVVGVDYRLAPENPFPAAIEDVWDAVAYFCANADSFGIDPENVYFYGYSAGANLAVATCLYPGVDRAWKPAGLALHYPFLDAAMDPYGVSVRDIDLSPDIMDAFNAWYLGDVDAREPLVSPVFASAEQLSGLPAVFLYPVSGDVLAQGADTFAARLAEAGVPCELSLVEGAYHGYVEDEANRPVYEATTMPDQIEARPQGMARIAEDAVRKSFTALLGQPANADEFAREFMGR